MFTFGLHAISDDWLSNLRDKHRPKCRKRAPKSSKNEMFLFGLHSISDDQLSDLRDKCQLKCEKRAPKSSKKKCSFLDYIQFLMIDQVI